ncbi:MAG: agmatinase [Candidatus Thermoplasmatota archaeon]|nr:agmatinase [Candidatus Thermoplasmatota archaeon]
MKLAFADDSEGAEIFFLGVPYDATTSFRPGARFGPEAIRDASYNFETYDCFLKKDIPHVLDLGNVTQTTSYKELSAEISSILRSKKGFPVIAGGEHSITPIIVRELKKRYEDLDVITIDAHMDFRDKYMDSKNSHACASRRVSEIVGIDNMMLLGIRSFSKEEEEDVEYYTSFEVHERLKEICDRVKEMKNVYLSIDMDGFDPAYAPGVGNPEPYGLKPEEVREIIDNAALVGCDVVELCPPYDYGNTACLAAKMIEEVIVRA